LLELEVTPNRPDLLSHRGMGRELATLLRTPFLPLEIPGAEKFSEDTSVVRVEAVDACPFYTAVRITGVTVKESPAWLKKRLESIGLRPINNIVDVTNFVLHELGQPLHAFDAAKIRGAIVVRKARDGENFNALVGSRHQLSGEDLVISDESGAPLALGGVMGGVESEVSESTTEVLLESAYFTPQVIRRSSRRLALTSDGCYRFERGVDPQGVLPASALAVKLILEIAGGVAGPTLLAGEAPVLTTPVVLNEKKLNQLMGGSVSLEAAEEILTRLGLSKLADGSWEIPSFRADLQRHIDLVEEIARVHGLDKVPSRFLGSFVPQSAVDKAYDADMVLRRRLAALGFYECQTIKLISDAQVSDVLPLRPMQDGDLIRVKLPLSEDHAVMRPSIVPGLIASAERNVRHGQKTLRFFEMGRVFRNAGGGKAKDQESETLALLVSGATQPFGWAQADRTADLYDLKGLLGALLPNRNVRFTPKDREGFALASEIKIDDQNVGVFARLSLAKERELDFTTPVFLAELDLAKLRKLLAGISQVDDLPQFPGSSRDAAMELPLAVSSGQVDAVIEKTAEPLLIAAECFDVFTDPSGVKLPADRKSVAYRFQYRAADRTLKAEEVDAAHQKMLKALTDGLGVKFR
jgi:phenylalanyl-tRNA synthetase beta chain